MVFCPGDIMVTNEPDRCDAVVYYSAWAWDDCDSAPFVTVLPPSGSTFPLGTSPVTVIARDASGNSNNCTFIVKVLGNCPTNCIEIHCPTNVVGYACGSNCVPVTYPLAFVTNRCDPTNLAVVYDPPLASCFGLGTHWVQVTAYGSGQSNQCSFPVTVYPDPNCTNQPPCLEIHSPTNIVEYVCGADCVPVDFHDVWAENRCNSNDVSWLTYPPAGTCFPIGDHSVDIWAYGSGQTDHRSITLTVLPDPNCGGCSSNLLVNGSFENPGVPGGYMSLYGAETIIPGWVTVLSGLEVF